MAWVKLDDQVPRHRKFLQAGPKACWLYVCGLCYCQSLNTDGIITKAALPTLGVQKGWQQCADALVRESLWEVTPNGYQIHDYLNYNRSRSEAIQQEDERLKQLIQAGIASGFARRQARDRRRSDENRRITEQKSNEGLNTDVQHPVNGDVEHPANIAAEPNPTPDPTVSRPDPTEEKRETGRRARVSVLDGTLPRDHLKHAFCSDRGKCVPMFLHEEFVKALGGCSRTLADERLQQFYVETHASWPPGPIGDEPVGLWRKCFAAVFPSVAPVPLRGVNRATASVLHALNREESYD